MYYLRALLIFVPVAVLVDFLGWDPVWVFFAAALGVVPLAGLLGQATEALAYYTGPRIGGLLNATLGNAAELIIAIFAIRAGLLDLVKAPSPAPFSETFSSSWGLASLLEGSATAIRNSTGEKPG